MNLILQQKDKNTGECGIQRMFETTRSPDYSQRSEFMWLRSFVERKKLMKGKERKIGRDEPPRGSGISGRF